VKEAKFEVQQIP